MPRGVRALVDKITHYYMQQQNRHLWLWACVCEVTYKDFC